MRAHIAAYKTQPRCGLALGSMFAIGLGVFFVQALLGQDAWVALDLLVAVAALAGVFLNGSNSGHVSGLQPLMVSAGLAGAACGHVAITHLGLAPVMAASLCATLAGLLAVRNIPVGVAAAAYSGVAAGTGVAAVLHGSGWILLAGLLAGLIASSSANVWAGIGGKIGFTGFLSSAMTLAVCEWLTGTQPPIFARPPADLAHLLMLPAAAVSATLTSLLINRLGWNMVLASALPSLLLNLTLVPIKSAVVGPLAAAWLGASFVGMTSTARIQRVWVITLAGFCFGVLMLRLQPLVVGHAGVLGSMACISVMAFAAIEVLLISSFPKKLRQRGDSAL